MLEVRNNSRHFKSPCWSLLVLHAHTYISICHSIYTTHRTHRTHIHHVMIHTHIHTFTHIHGRTHTYMHTHHGIYLCVNLFCMLVRVGDTVFTSFQELPFCQRVLRQNHAFDAIMPRFNVCATVYVRLCDSDHAHNA
jgi:hypothetical protein